MAARTFAWVPVDALRELVDHAGEVTERVSLYIPKSDSEQYDADLQAKVEALGVEELTH